MSAEPTVLRGRTRALAHAANPREPRAVVSPGQVLRCQGDLLTTKPS